MTFPSLLPFVPFFYSSVLPFLLPPPSPIPSFLPCSHPSFERTSSVKIVEVNIADDVPCRGVGSRDLGFVPWGLGRGRKGKGNEGGKCKEGRTNEGRKKGTGGREAGEKEGRRRKKRARKVRTEGNRGGWQKRASEKKGRGRKEGRGRRVTGVAPNVGKNLAENEPFRGRGEREGGGERER